MLAAREPSADLATRDFERILLIKPSSLGDVIHALPVLHGLRRRYPGARIDWLISSSLSSLLEGHPDISNLILFDRRRLGGAWRSLSAARELIGFLRRLRAPRYDLVVDLQGLFRTGFFAWATRAAVRIGFSEAREGGAHFYTHRLPPHPHNTHAVDRNWSAARALGFADLPIEFNLALTDVERNHARRVLAESGLSPSRRPVVVLPTARWETKVWLPQRFAEVIDDLQQHGDLACVLLGTADEREVCSRIAKLCRRPPINLAGKTPLRTLAAILEQAVHVLGHDSGPMHVAVALGRPVTCIVGPTNPARTGPYRRADAVLRLDLPCSPCYLRRLSQCGYQHQCMRDLSTATVLAAARRSLAKPTPSPAPLDALPAGG